MAGEYDAQLNVGVKVDQTSGLNQFADFTRKIESRPIKVRFDTQPLGSITGKVNDFEKSLAAASSRVIAFGASAGQVFLVSQALDELVKSTINVQKELANIGVILGLSGNQLNQFSAQLFGIANLTAQSFKSVADVSLLFSRQGLGVEETLKRTAAAFTLVRIGGVDAEDAVKAITTTLNTFNEVGLDAIAIANRIASVDSRFSVSGAVIVDALTRVASTAQETGVSFNNLIGITTALQQITNRGGSVIGNALKSIFTRIERPETIDQLNKMGIATEDLNGKMLGADEILRNLAKRYKDLSTAQQQQVNSLAAGLFQINQFKALIGDLAKDNGIATRASAAAGGASDQAVRRQAELNKTLAAQYQVAVNNATQFAAKIGNVAIAPALTNVFKGINAATGPQDDVGKFLGEGILKGLGNYLSGPGLALVGILATKLFLSFSSQAARSFAQILEVGTTRIQNERAVNDLLASQPGAYDKINAAAGNEAKQQQIILDLLNEQNIALNVRASATAKVSSLVGSSVGGIPLTNKPLAISGEKVVASGGRFAGFSALSEAIDREKRAGIDVSQIRVGQSGQLISSDNPLGIGIYNLKDEPLGLNQGINRVVKGGGNPKTAGDVPNFADIPYPYNLLPESLLPEEFKKKVQPFFDPKSLAPDSVRFGTPPGIPSQPLLLGNGTGKNAINLPQITQSTQEGQNQLQAIIQKELDKKFPPLLGIGSGKTAIQLSSAKTGIDFQNFGGFPPELRSAFANLGQGIPQANTASDYVNNLKRQNPTAQVSANLLSKEESSFSFADVNAKKALTNPFKTFGNFNTQLDTYIDKVKKEFVDPLDAAHQKTLKIFSDASATFGSDIKSITDKRINDLQTSLQNDPRLLQSQQEAQNLSIRQRTQDFNLRSSNLGIGSSLLGFLPNSNYAKLKAEAEEGGFQGQFNKQKQAIAGRALVGSFVLPLIAGIGQQGSENLFGKDTTAARGTTAAIGAAGNIGAYALTGAGLAGPYGALGGLVVGLATELPTAIKAFSDTLPDLQRNLDALKESTTKTNDAFTGYINTSNQLQNIDAGGQKVSIGQRNTLLNQQNQSFNQLPSEAQSQIRAALKAGRPDDVYSIASSYNTIGQQNIAALEDAKTLKSAKASDFAPISNGLSPSFALPLLDPRGNRFDPTGGLHNGISRQQQAAQEQQRQLQNVNPELKGFATSLLDFQNKDSLSLQQVLQGLNPKDIKNLNASSLPSFLAQHGYGKESIDDFSQKLDAIKEKPGGEALVNSLITPQSVQGRFNDSQDYKVAGEKQIKEIDGLNSKLANLTVTGTAAINDFEINVITRLAQSLTKLKIQGIESDKISKISEINSGNNDYNKTFFDYQRNNVAAQNTFGQETNKAQSDFTNKVGQDFYNVIDNFTKGLAGTGKDKATDLSDLSENKRNELNSVLDGFFTIDKDFKASLTDKGQNISTSNISNISNNIQSKINQLENQKNTQGNSLIPDASTLLSLYPHAKNVQEAISLSGNSSSGSDLSAALSKLPDKGASILNLTPQTIDDANTSRQNIDEIIKSYQSLLAKLTQDSADLNKNLIEAKNNLDSAFQVNYKQLLANYDILSAQFVKQEGDSLSANDTKLQFSASAFDLSRQAQISNPVQAIQLNGQAQLLQQKGSLINELRTSTGSDFGFGANTSLNDIQSERDKQAKATLPNDFIGPLTQQEQSQRGTVQGLTKLYDDLTKSQKDNAQSVAQQIQSLTKFTDVESGLVLQQNINNAGQGTLTGKNFAQAALAPLQYNTETFNRDAITGLQEFSSEVKDDLGKNLLSVTQGAKNASQAFRDLGLSLAESLEKKATDIGINSLFGVLTSAGGSLFSGFGNGKSGGGYIPKFARGGFVNMGSGTKDDVPAYLSGGEFVINKNAVSKIGKSNLDALNSPHFADGGTFRQPSQFDTRNQKQINKIGLTKFQGVTSDTISGNATSADITLADAFTFNNKTGTKGTLNTSSLLSSIGASDQNDPQNKLKFSRQKYALSKTLAERQYQQQLAAYNVSQDIGLGQAYLGAIGTVAGAAFSGGASSGSGPTTDAQAGQPLGASLEDINSYGATGGGSYFGLPSFQAGTLGLPDASSIGGSFSSSNYASLFSPSLNFAGKVGGASILRAKGGYIPKFTNGGYFGGDSSSDKFSAMVMGGEYVASPQTVSKYGVNYFKGLNDAGKYANGGSVGASLYGGSDTSSTQMINLLTQISNKLGAENSNVAPTATAGAQPQSAATTNHVTINLGLNQNGTTTNENSSTSSTGGSNTSATDQQNLKKIGDQLKAQTILILTNESRPGGLLASTFARKTT